MSSRYMELPSFKDSDTHTATFAIIVYILWGQITAVVTDEGQDVNGNVSNIIAAHGICSLWTQNEKEIK